MGIRSLTAIIFFRGTRLLLRRRIERQKAGGLSPNGHPDPLPTRQETHFARHVEQRVQLQVHVLGGGGPRVQGQRGLFAAKIGPFPRRNRPNMRRAKGH